jgi:hypothetical protein
MESVERVVVYLPNGQSVVGNLHVPRHSRLLDILNHQADIRPFFALTDVEWHAEGGIVRHPFVCLHRNNVIAVHPAK